MRNRVSLIGVLIALLVVATDASAALSSYSQDFELLDQTDPFALADDGWLVYGNCFAPNGTTYLYGYGPFPAPNDGFAFCQIDLLQGGVEQGAQQLVVFSDYNNVDHDLGYIIESNTFQEQTIGAEDVGETWVFSFQAKRGNLIVPSTAAAFIKTLNPAAGWALTNFLTEDMSAIPTTWGEYSISIDIDASVVGQILQFGYLNRATHFDSAGIFYDNISFQGHPTSVPPSRLDSGATLAQNYPNPFNPRTRIEFTLAREERVSLRVFDLAGRRVATLHEGVLPAGGHSVLWDGRGDDRTSVASGLYHYVLQTSEGRLTRSMVLVK